MKTVLKLITLILLIHTIYIPYTFAQSNVVKVIYFYPNDRTPQADINTELDTKMKNAQTFFAGVMELYGYGSKTFSLETDGSGNVVVHHFQGAFNDAHYHDNPFSKVLDELDDTYNSTENIYFVAIDIDSDVLEVEFRGTDVEACGIASGNWGATPAHGNCFNYVIIAHELGHTFGLDHDAFSSGNIDPMINSPCSAAWLDLHPYFNGGNSDRGHTTINMLEPRLAPEEGKVRFIFEVSDPDGLHLSRIFVYELDTVIACNSLEGIDDGTIFLDIGYIPQSDPTASLTIMDKNGNYTGYIFDLNTAELLRGISVHIPDSYLAAIIREQTNLQSGAQITTQTLARLTSLELTDASRPITNLTGLEQAYNLETLLIQNQQQLSDFSVLSSLTQLTTLEISNSGLSDISILSVLTNLQHLNLANNAIQEISTLSGLTSLTSLDLRYNQITNVNPLETLTNLEKIWVVGNPITDTSPLFRMYEQNPGLQLYIDTEHEVSTPNNEPTFLEGENAVRWVLEKTPIGTKVGSAISATDIDNDTLTYSISSYGDAGVFEIDSSTGQLKTREILDYNTQNLYILDVSVSDDRNGSASIRVTINIAQAGVNKIIPELIPIHVSFSELMITSRGGLHSLSQWMELYNGSQTETANLRGWTLAIEARDRNGTHRHAIIQLEDLDIPPQKTGLIVTWNARQKSDIIPEDRIYHFFNHHFDEFEQNTHRNMIIGLVGFSLKLSNPEGILVDIVGNLDGDPSTNDEPDWEIPSGTTTDRQRTSLIRRYAKETHLPLDGTEMNSWRRTADFPLTVSTFWGNSTDIGNPGYRSTGTLPVTLSHFRAEHTENGAVLTWTTESEIDNAGFYILRSETRNGLFKAVTPRLIQGAGTTGKRNEYTWTDTTIQLNTRYYYRIVDVSYAGVQQQLATVGLRGLLSPQKKDLTSWADLKIK